MIALDIPMPKACLFCPCYDRSFHECGVIGDNIDDELNRPKWCPMLYADKVNFKQIIDPHSTLGQFYNMRHFSEEASAAFARHIFNNKGLVKLEKLSCDESFCIKDAEEYSATAFMVRLGE